MKEVMLDIGELGWSFYLSAHIRWMRFEQFPIPSVMTMPGREVLYRELAGEILFPPGDMYFDLDISQQNRFTVSNMNGKQLRKYFNPFLPMDHQISLSQPFDQHLWYKVYPNQMHMRPFHIDMPEYNLTNKKKEIFVFPRHRKHKNFKFRNLSKEFYVDLINMLCDKFPDYIIRSIGTKDGAYNIPSDGIVIQKNNIGQENYINSVGNTTIEQLINLSKYAVAAIGSQSAPLKLMLLEGVPTFMIGHEKKRHTEIENWMGTRVGFYEVGKNEYNELDQYPIKYKICFDNILEFLK